MHTHAHALAHTHARTHAHSHTHAHTHTHTHTHTHSHTHTRTHAHTLAHTHTHSHTRTHTHNIYYFLPLQSDAQEAENFDAVYTKQKVFLTPPDPMVMLNLDNEDFDGFSYKNPEYC